MRTLNFSELFEAYDAAGAPDRIYMSRLHSPLDLIAAYKTTDGPVRIFGAEVCIRYDVPPNEIWFGFGETRPLREKIVL